MKARAGGETRLHLQGKRDGGKEENGWDYNASLHATFSQNLRD